MIGMIGCSYHPMDISDKDIPAEILLEANSLGVDSLNINHLFIIRGAGYDYVFTNDKKTSNVKLYAKYDIGDSSATSGVAFLAGIVLMLLMVGVFTWIVD